MKDWLNELIKKIKLSDLNSIKIKVSNERRGMSAYAQELMKVSTSTSKDNFVVKI